MKKNINKKKKLFIYHPYSDSEFGQTVDKYYLFKKKFDSKKKLYLIQYLVNDEQVKKKIKTIFFINRKKNFFIYLGQIIKLYLWGIFNNLKIQKIRFTSNISLLSKGTIFYANARNTLRQKPVMFLKKTKCTKLFNLSHLEVETSRVSKNAKEIGVDYFVFENNLTKNSRYFKYYFNYYKKDTLVLPHTYGKRFIKYTNFKDRKNLCFASGRVIILNKSKDLGYRDFLNFYNLKYQHKIRYEIYKNKNRLNGLINSYVSLQDKLNLNYTKINQKKSREYYSNFDIVKMYNTHKMFVAPEGINDTPPIGFAEGMACGSALIAIDDPMYSDLGIIKNKHYIDYDGSLEDLIEKIKFYQKNLRKLELIAINGYEFVTKKLNPYKVTMKFVDKLNEIN